MVYQRSLFEEAMKDLEKCSVEELAMMKAKLQVAWDCCFSVGEYSICDTLSARVFVISDILNEKLGKL